MIKPEDITRELRGYGSNATERAEMLANAIRKEHRTHQANIVRNLLTVLINLSEAPTDLRNQAAIDACSKVKELDIGIPYI